MTSSTNPSSTCRNPRLRWQQAYGECAYFLQSAHRRPPKSKFCGRWSLGIGEAARIRFAPLNKPCPPRLRRALADAHVERFAIVSADNPKSCAGGDNSQRRQRLQQRLSRLRIAAIHTLHVDPHGQWPDEQGYFLPHAGLRLARALGRQCGQNAVLWGGRNARLRLLWLI